MSRSKTHGKCAINAIVMRQCLQGHSTDHFLLMIILNGGRLHTEMRMGGEKGVNALDVFITLHAARTVNQEAARLHECGSNGQQLVLKEGLNSRKGRWWVRPVEQ